MKLLRRLLWLALGLIYRLIVLALFERWIPFPERPDERPAPRAAHKQPVARERAPARHAQEGAPGARVGRPAEPEQPSRPPIFAPHRVAPSSEPVAALESERLALRPRLAAEPLPATSRARLARPLHALLRDKRALAGAIVLGEALERRRSR